MSQVSCKGCNHYGYIERGKCSYCGRRYLPITSGVFRSQKATGIMVLPSLASGFHGRSSYDLLHTLKPLGVLQDFGALMNDAPSLVHLPQVLPLFARPCPTVPRHGFVDSRIVNSLEEIKQVWEETIQADPGGELLLCGFLESTMNAVLTPTMLSMGAGHDGATGGKNTINIPLARMGWWDRQEAESNILTDARIKSGEDPYIELVLGKGKMFPTLTQLRGGPRLEGGSADFIPSRVVVSQILKVDTSMSLLDWERLIESNKGTEGLVVHHPGGSPVDHFSVHARTYGIPVITTFEPLMGVELEPIPTIPLTPKSILEGIATADLFQFNLTDYDQWRSDAEQATHIALMALHNSPAFQGDDGFWVGLGVGLLIRLGTTALQGESRYCRKDGDPNLSREQVYARVLNRSLKANRLKVTQLTHIFRYGQFTSTGIGGRAWAACGKALGELINTVGPLAREEADAVGELMRAYNLCINQAHNGGWWLNKYADDRAFDRAQDGDPRLIASSISMLYRLACLRQAVDLSKTDYHRWRPLLFKPVRAEVKFEKEPSLDGVKLKVSDRILSGRAKGIVVGGEEIKGKLLDLISNNLTLRTTSKGRELVLKLDKPLILWQEPELDLSANTAKK